MAQLSTIYSIGHGQKSVEDFIAELMSFGVQYLADVRSAPYSRWVPQFNREAIGDALRESGIRYLYMGDALGGWPESGEFLDGQGHCDYKKMAAAKKFRDGLMRIATAASKQIPLAVMCSESNPEKCHRAKLIGRELYFEHHWEMLHIVGRGQVVPQSELMERLSFGIWSPRGGLFGGDFVPYFRSDRPVGIVSDENGGE